MESLNFDNCRLFLFSRDSFQRGGIISRSAIFRNCRNRFIIARMKLDRICRYEGYVNSLFFQKMKQRRIRRIYTSSITKQIPRDARSCLTVILLIFLHSLNNQRSNPRNRDFLFENAKNPGKREKKTATRRWLGKQTPVRGAGEVLLAPRGRGVTKGL